MERGYGSDRQLADVRHVTRRQLDHSPEPLSPEEPAGTPGHDQRDGLAETAERRHVQVIGVQMRQQHGLRRRQGFAERDESPQMSHVAAQERVGQELDAVQLDQRGRVPDVEDRSHRS